jgi:hypothetical protein
MEKYEKTWEKYILKILVYISPYEYSFQMEHCGDEPNLDKIKNTFIHEIYPSEILKHLKNKKEFVISILMKSYINEEIYCDSFSINNKINKYNLVSDISGIEWDGLYRSNQDISKIKGGFNNPLYKKLPKMLHINAYIMTIYALKAYNDTESSEIDINEDSVLDEIILENCRTNIKYSLVHFVCLHKFGIDILSFNWKKINGNDIKFEKEVISKLIKYTPSEVKELIRLIKEEYEYKQYSVGYKEIKILNKLNVLHHYL